MATYARRAPKARVRLYLAIYRVKCRAGTEKELKRLGTTVSQLWVDPGAERQFNFPMHEVPLDFVRIGMKM